MKCRSVTGVHVRLQQIFSPTVHGEDYLLVDYFSTYPEVSRLRNKTTKSVIEIFKEKSARHGVSDNMPFASHEMIAFPKIVVLSYNKDKVSQEERAS